MDPTLIVDIMATLAFTSALLAIFFYLPWRIRRSYRQTFIAIARAVEAREPHLLGHAEQTARYVVLMARWRGMSFAETRRLEYAALLHGIGKVGVPYGLLNSPACLTCPADRFVLRDYVRIGAAILDRIPILSSAADAVRFQHEYVDGSGYPFGRYGKDIPAHAQMLCIASEYVAMTTPRLYRAGLALTLAEADTYLRAQIGRRYSARMATLFRRAKATERLRLALLRCGRSVLRLVLKFVPNQPFLPGFSRRIL
jgi:HD-GYP domain-containing protein (c-di-GMP phosphodiesterase class II)